MLNLAQQDRETAIIETYHRLRAELGRIPTTREIAARLGITHGIVQHALVKNGLERSKRRGRRPSISESQARACLLRFVEEDITLRQLAAETGFPSSTLYAALIRANGGTSPAPTRVTEIVIEVPKPAKRRCLRCGHGPIPEWFCKRCRLKNSADAAGALIAV